MCLHTEAGAVLNVYHLIGVVLEFADNGYVKVQLVPLDLFIYLFFNEFVMFKISFSSL